LNDGKKIFRRSTLDMDLSSDFTGVYDRILGKAGHFQKAGKINMKTPKKEGNIKF
jgi:hypothetical protein